ncbi:hypothetical protein BGZ83_010792 [Gryganskiella cystojenkinii]|nr:hypothetical protein BGZ83_010792 [Gryganskiella cystojenkinii]
MTTTTDSVAPSSVPEANKVLSSKELADLSQAKDNVHNLVYFPFHGLVGCLRVLLVLLDEPYKFTALGFPEWMKQKALTPFGHVPVLREETKCGRVLELAEISFIEQYLARRFPAYSSLLGANFWEESQIKMFTSSTHALFSFLIHTITSLPNKETDRPVFFERFKKTKLPEWIQFHEKHLQENGCNGHYVGEQLSLADIKTGTVVEHLVRLCGDEVQISQELTPGIWAVKANLDKIPAYAEWTTSEQYQKYTGVNIGFFGV